MSLFSWITVYFSDDDTGVVLSLELERVSLSLSHTHTIALVSHPCTPLRRAGASSQADRCTWRCRSGFCRPFLWRRSRPARPCTRPGLQRERERERSNDYHLHSCVCVCVCVYNDVIWTSAHPVVVTQHVSRRTHALIRAEGVDAAESAEQRVHRALVNVWTHRIKMNTQIIRENNHFMNVVCDKKQVYFISSRNI